MLFIDNKGITDPRINLAIEEYVLRHLPTDHSYLLFYINERSIIIGKNQNTIEEVNEPYVAEKGIHVVRRLSGGGAVYHDLGNLNFSFITKDDGKSFLNFQKFTEPVVQALQNLGVDAELKGRNDLVVGERKISGNAMFATKGRMFSHGTLLFDSEIDDVVSALRVKEDKIISKGIKSIRSRVANISEFLTEKMTIEQFRSVLLTSIFNEAKEIPTYQLSEEDWEKINQLSEEKYGQWDWNYGQSPKFAIHHSKRYPIGQIDVRLDVKDGQIKSCLFSGDFFGVGDVAELAELLIGTTYNKEAIEKVFSEIDLSYYFGNIKKEEIIKLIHK